MRTLPECVYFKHGAFYYVLQHVSGSDPPTPYQKSKGWREISHPFVYQSKQLSNEQLALLATTFTLCH